MIVRQMKIQSETPRCSGLEHLGQGHHPTSWVGNAVSLCCLPPWQCGYETTVEVWGRQKSGARLGSVSRSCSIGEAQRQVPGPGCRSSISLGNSHGYLHFLDTWGQNGVLPMAAEYRVPHMPHVYLAYYEYLVPQVRKYVPLTHEYFVSLVYLVPHEY